MKHVILFAISCYAVALLTCSPCVAQQDSAQLKPDKRVKAARPGFDAKPGGLFRANAIFFDIGGQGGLFSINYERFIGGDFAIKAGVGGIPQIFGGGFIPIGNVMFNYITSSRTTNGHLELGFGVLGALAGKITGSAIGSGTFGYRHQSPGGSGLFRIAFTPMFTTDGVEPWAVIGFGGRF